MSLPETVRVKLSSEAAEYISLTPVVVQDLPLRELVEHLLGVTGKDEARIRELLLRGTLVSGGSRFRWGGWEADPAGLRALLATFPDPDPARAFDPARCVRVTLRTTRLPIQIPREAGARKPLLRRTSFWDALMDVAAAAGPRYQDYSYRDRSDIYHLALSPGAAARLRQASNLLTYTKLRDQLAAASLEAAGLYVLR